MLYEMIIAMLALAATSSLCIGAPNTLADGEISSTTISPYKAPIFRETDLNGENTATESNPPQLDGEMTPAERIEKLYSRAAADEGPAAYIKLGGMDEYWANSDPSGMGSDEQALKDPHPFDHIFEQQRLQYALVNAKTKLNSIFKNAMEPPRSARDFQAIRLGASLQPQEKLASNINSYVPDGFNDGEIVHMFELNEALRTGEKSLNATELAETNSFLLGLYLRALTGLKGPIVIEPTSEEGTEKCHICYDSLNEEPSLSLVDCGHGYHIDCLQNWVRGGFVLKCPDCKRRFRQSFDLPETQ